MTRRKLYLVAALLVVLAVAFVALRRVTVLNMKPREPQMIADLRRAGFDPGREHDVDHHLYFPSQQAADGAAGALRHNGYTAEVRREDDNPNWLVLASHRIVPADTDVEQLLSGLRQLAADHGGTYDGWEAGPAE